uniref:Uncharacterized protein n=1 Tax=Mycena chlorophos TaxID=658473 RepID=A0ABQ0LCA4_MYCCL|nr:predicted protein [Mycena chlorophos]
MYPTCTLSSHPPPCRARWPPRPRRRRIRRRPVVSTAPSTPPPDDEDKTVLVDKSDEVRRASFATERLLTQQQTRDPFFAATGDAKPEPETAEDDDDGLTEDKYPRLKSILDRSMTYRSVFKTQMEPVRRQESAKKRPAKRGRPSKTVTEEMEEAPEGVRQYALVTGGKLKDYQLEGLA